VVDGGQGPSFEAGSSPFEKAAIVGRLESDEIIESSGIAASRCQESLLWTHNDSGDGAYIFAMDERGKHLGTWKLENADNKDWEDISSYSDASGNCFLIIGDIGNSRKDRRTEHKIYRLAEPTVQDVDRGSSRKAPGIIPRADVLTFAYPDEAQDAETLMVHPASGDIYIVTKERNKPAGVYRLRPEFGSAPVKAERISDLTVPAIPNGFVTGGEISPDGSRLVICDYFAAYEFTLPPQNGGFEDVWKQKPVIIDLADRQQGEAIAYASDGKAVIATSEGKNQPLLRAARRE